MPDAPSWKWNEGKKPGGGSGGVGGGVGVLLYHKSYTGENDFS